MKYIKKSVIIEATQWFKNGDHPLDACTLIKIKGDEPFLSEGKIVRYFRRPDVSGETICDWCKTIFNYHGWIDTSEGNRIVCPGDWIITGIKGEYYAWKPDVFESTYEPVEVK